MIRRACCAGAALVLALAGCGPDPNPSRPAPALPSQTGGPTASAPGPTPAGYLAIAVQGGGTITGRVRARVPTEPPRPLRVTRDVGPCGAREIAPEDRVVNAQGGLRWAVVRIEGIRTGKPLTSLPPARLDNRGCTFVPHVVLVAAGAPVAFSNQDATLHTVDAFPRRNTLSVSLAQGTREQRTLAEPEGPIHLECQLHSWMSGWLWVCEHPYFAVTDADGAFVLTDVPVGEHELRIWAEHAESERSLRATVPAGGTVAVEVVFE